MMFGVIGLLIGVLILGAGIYYLSKEKDADSQKIYKGVTTVGGVITLVMVIVLVL